MQCSLWSGSHCTFALSRFQAYSWKVIVAPGTGVLTQGPGKAKDVPPSTAAQDVLSAPCVTLFDRCEHCTKHTFRKHSSCSLSAFLFILSLIERVENISSMPCSCVHVNMQRDHSCMATFCSFWLKAQVSGAASHRRSLRGWTQRAEW